MNETDALAGTLSAADQVAFKSALESTDEGRRFREMLRGLRVLQRIKLIRQVLKAKEEEPTLTWSEILRAFLTIVLEYLPLFLDLLT